MIWLYVLLTATVALELLITIRPVWKFRRPLATVCMFLVSFATAGLLMQGPDLLAVTIAVVSAYRAFNLARVMEDRMHEQFARHMVRRTTLWLGLAQLAVFISDWTGATEGLQTVQVLYAMAGIQLIIALLMSWTFVRQLRASAPRHDPPSIVDRTLPSVTVAVPARNEDAQLEACLTSILASDYPKLEVIVLDDCSQDRTPDIIRSYAHAGVRFIRGSEPHDGWLAKNQAYDRLYEEASGSMILFCGVDVRFDRFSIRQLVLDMRGRKKSMMSVMPLNPGVRTVPLVQAMRYYWEMVPPRRLFRRPPVLSSCWIVEKAMLARTGGFPAVRRSITPEAHFAKAAIQDDAYSFIRSDARLGITSQKQSQDQYDTALQTRYPQMHRRPEVVLAVAASEAGLLVTPLAVAVYALVTLDLPLLLPVALAFALQVMIYVRLQSAVFPDGRHRYLSFVPAVFADIALLHYSMYRYEFSEVYWKGRNVCYPVMHATPNLPKQQ